jgi:hypothetical protein
MGQGALRASQTDQLRSARATGSFIAALLLVLSVDAGAGVVMPPTGGVAIGVVFVDGWLASAGAGVEGEPEVLDCANTRPTEPTTARAAMDEVMKLDVFMGGSFKRAAQGSG